MRVGNLGIRTELTLALVLAGALAATFVVLFFPARQAKVAHDLLDRAAANTAVVAGRSNAAALEFDDPESAAASLRDLSANPDIEFAMIFRPSGKIFAEYRRRPIDLSWIASRVGEGTELPATLAWKNYRIGIWSIEGGEKLGTVVVGFATAHTDTVIRESRTLAIAVGFGMLLFLSLCGIALGQLVGRPLRASTVVMQEIASDDRTLGVRVGEGASEPLGKEPTSWLWPAEIIVLRDSFLEMLRRLAKSRRELEDLTASLEERVKERTLELEERDRALEARNTELRSKASMLVSRNAALEQARQTLEDQRKELERANAELAKVSQLKSEFLANMSHEIRTPLNGIAGFIELALDSEGLAKEQREYLEIAHRSTETLTALINDILDFSKIEAGRLELEHIQFCVRDLVESVRELLAVRAQSKGLALLADVSADVPSALVGDPTRLRQILVNLVGNAIKFTESGHVALRVQSLGESENKVWLRFAVVDTGIGIPPDKEQAIFESFTQADGSTTRKYGGTGLGLAISRKLVEQMGGEIGLDSVVGLGSTFWCRIPFGRAQSVAVSAEPALASAEKEAVGRPTALDQELSVEPAPAGKQTGKEARILVAEDNPVNRKLVLTILGKLGYVVDTAVNGKEALQAVLSTEYSLVLMDVQMPEMDGLEATRRIREAEGEGRRTPIVAMTAHAMKGDRERCLEAGADDYLSKPVRAQQLLECVERWTAEISDRDGGTKMKEAKTETREAVDAERLSESTAGDRELALELASLFLEATPAQLEALREALEADDRRRVAEISHTLKGSCGSLGATPMEDLCKRIEAEAARSSLDGAKALLEQAVEEFERVRSYVEKMKSAPEEEAEGAL